MQANLIKTNIDGIYLQLHNEAIYTEDVDGYDDIEREYHLVLDKNKLCIAELDNKIVSSKDLDGYNLHSFKIGNDIYYKIKVYMEHYNEATYVYLKGTELFHSSEIVVDTGFFVDILELDIDFYINLYNNSNYTNLDDFYKLLSFLGFYTEYFNKEKLILEHYLGMVENKLTFKYKDEEITINFDSHCVTALNYNVDINNNNNIDTRLFISVNNYDDEYNKTCHYKLSYSFKDNKLYVIKLLKKFIVEELELCEVSCDNLTVGRLTILDNKLTVKVNGVLYSKEI